MKYGEIVIVIICIIILLIVFVRSQSIIVYRFYRPTCIHCISSQGEWDKFANNCLLKFIRPVGINLDKSENQSLANMYSVTGVPQVIKVLPSGQYEVYMGDRNADAYMQWVIQK